MKVEDDIAILTALRVPFKRRLIELVLHIKREHPALTDDELLNAIFPPETKEDWQARRDAWQKREEAKRQQRQNRPDAHQRFKP